MGVGEIAALGGFHNVATAPQVMGGVVDGNLADAELVGELDGAVDGAIGYGLAEFFVGVPAFGGGEAARQRLDLGTGLAAADRRTE